MNILQAFDEIRRRIPADEPGANTKRGALFERLIQTYLREDPQYVGVLAEVWLWKEWPGRQGADTGIDLVAREHGGDLWAIQCKFYDAETPLPKSGIDSFLAASGRAHGRHHFARRFIFSSTDKWSPNAEKELHGQNPPCHRVGLAQLADSAVDFARFFDAADPSVAVAQKKTPRPHQLQAMRDVIAGFQNADRGKLIMACGTGKTFTSLRIAESIVQQPDAGGNILFLVPSISLLSQSLREWATEAEIPQRNFAVCSDVQVGKDKEGMRAYELAYPTTTDAEVLARKLTEPNESGRVNIVFSTYHSIAVVAEAQRLGAPQFDLVVCDEAHRTTGVERPADADTLAGKKETSYFVKIHDGDYIKAHRRLYMTATPRIYSAGAKEKAAQNEIDYFSMDDAAIYGEEFHRLDFSDAVAQNLLSDYRVLVLAVDEGSVSKAMQNQLAQDGELSLADAIKIIGCWNGLGKRLVNYDEAEHVDAAPMRRAVAFTHTIANSKQFTDMFAQIIAGYRKANPNADAPALTCEVKHVDGKQNSMLRDAKLAWLRQDAPVESEDAGTVCRVLSNARCLSEGVDVPALDAVMFLNPRKSVVDVVQSVGRVMRKAADKQYGYIILPIGVPAGVPAHEALKDNKRYAVVWEVLQALRAHDNRFNAIINQLELNKNRPSKIQIIGVGGDEEAEGDAPEAASEGPQLQLPMDIEEWRNAIYAKIVLKCGDRKYWETWAQDIAEIAESNIARINELLADSHGEARRRFNEFHTGLCTNINPSIGEAEAVEMLAQHMITKPVFNALFDDYNFAAQNPVSQTMQVMIDLLEAQNLTVQSESLTRFYQSVRERAAGIDNPEGKQKVIIELYDKFFKTAFPKMAARLGIVYTPVEVIDFILQSAQDVMMQEFGRGLTDEDVDILDPFTGTGSFIVRMLQGDYIRDADLPRKYREEIHANEIVLLAYYIAAVNIEGAYHARLGGEYEPFPGILLADTFQLGEEAGAPQTIFAENLACADRQRRRSIRVIVGNPPYSIGQRSENDANRNVAYPHLDVRIRDTYARHSAATKLNNLYDSYVRAIRWASDRIGEQGVIAFVSNGSYIDGNSMDGVRKSLGDEFSALYCFNLRGNIRENMQNRESGEGQNIFGQASMTGVAVTVFVKKAGDANAPCKIHYHDIGDNLKRPEKLAAVQAAGSVARMEWQTITPNAAHDWINQRHPEFAEFLPMGDSANKKRAESVASVFTTYCLGVISNRDAWVYNFSRENLARNMRRMIAFYNEEVARYRAHGAGDVDAFVNNDGTKIKWNKTLKDDLRARKLGAYDDGNIRTGIRQPYTKQHHYFDKQFNNSVHRLLEFFPTADADNRVICVSGVGAGPGFSALMVDRTPDMHLVSKTQCFPFYIHQSDGNGGVTRAENIPDAALAMFRKHYNDAAIDKWDIFHYVYGILHSPQYKSKYAADLKKMLPRVPLHAEFGAFAEAGRRLGELHVNYESAPEYPLKEWAHDLVAQANRDVVKMRFPKRRDGERGAPDKTAIVYNNSLTLQGIPADAYRYVVGGKSAIEWVMDRYQVKTDKDSQIGNDPNQYGDPGYIVRLLKKVVQVSVETVKIVDELPEFDDSASPKI